MKYIRTKDGIITEDIATHELEEDICDAGYYRTLTKGSLCKIGSTWCNFYGKWTTILDTKGQHYDIRPEEVKKVVKPLKQADTIEELCDYKIVILENGEHLQLTMPAKDIAEMAYYKEIYGAIWVRGECSEPILKSVAKMKGILPNSEIDWEIL